MNGIDHSHSAVSDLPAIARNEVTKQSPVAGPSFNKIALLAAFDVMPAAEFVYSGTPHKQ